SEIAIKIRQNVLNNDYSLCNLNACNHKKSDKIMLTDSLKQIFKPVMDKGPEVVTFNYDRECNIACVICRDEVYRYKDEELKYLNEQIETLFLPLLKSAKIVKINSHGDAFGSRHSRLLIKRVHETYPNIKFEIFTNGILANKKNIEALNIHNNIDNIQISIHSATKETYSKIVRNGELYFDKLMENLKYISELKKQLNIYFHLFFVVTALNYQDIPKFVTLATELNALPKMWEYRDEQLASAIRHPEYCITDANHPEHEKLIEILNDPVVLQSQILDLSPILLEIQRKGKINS
ncbi:radical SAM protein, partial [bacterium]|nr:radical SAM protein [bacterium]